MHVRALIFVNTYINFAIRGSSHVGGTRESGISHLADNLGRIPVHLHCEDRSITNSIE